MVKNTYEKLYWGKKSLVCGIDEAGRGPLAGPVVAAAAIVPIGTTYKLLKDSKIMTVAERNRAYSWIMKKCWYGVGIVPAHQIDHLNIWHATIKAMQRAVIQLMSVVPVKPAALLVDAMPLTLDGIAYTEMPVHSFIYGERKSCSIAAASIVAKVTRDRLMKRMHFYFPQYNLVQHKGYGTRMHRQTLLVSRPSLIHRSTFITVISKKKGADETRQQKLC